jgi:hypothetical protein
MCSYTYIKILKILKYFYVFSLKFNKINYKRKINKRKINLNLKNINIYNNNL